MTRDDSDKERWYIAGQVVLRPPSLEVRGRWVDLAITDLADSSLRTRTARISSPPFVRGPRSCFQNRFANDDNNSHQHERWRRCGVVG